MDRVAKELKRDALSNTQMEELFGDSVRIWSYPELSQLSHLDQMWGTSGAAIVLYETSKDYGHWTCLFKRDAKTIEFFDSLGSPDGKLHGAPDAQLKFIKPHFRHVSHQWVPHLLHLIEQSPYRCVYSSYRLQRNVKDVNTCGRWVTCRLILRHLTADQFAKLFLNQKLDADSYVALLTAFY